VIPVQSLLLYMEEKFKEIYYKPEHLWKGHTAIDKLADLTKSTKQETKQWPVVTEETSNCSHF
jgi:hypothetical protein